MINNKLPLATLIFGFIFALYGAFSVGQQHPNKKIIEFTYQSGYIDGIKTFDEIDDYTPKLIAVYKYNKYYANLIDVYNTEQEAEAGCKGRDIYGERTDEYQVWVCWKKEILEE